MSMQEALRAADELEGLALADLERLSPETWDRPSDCAGWTVKAVLIHLIQVADLFIDSARRGLAGDAGPPPMVASEGIPAWRAWRAARLQEALSSPPEHLLADYRARRATMQDLVKQITTRDSGALAWHPVGPRPIAWWADQWLFELTLHDWDRRVPFDPDAGLRPASLAAFARTLPARLARGFAAADDPALAGRYRVELEGDPPLAWVVRVGGGAVESPAEDGGPADATIRSDPTAFALVMTNRRPVDRFAAVGRWHVSGDRARADRLARAFRSY